MALANASALLELKFTLANLIKVASAWRNLPAPAMDEAQRTADMAFRLGYLVSGVETMNERMKLHSDLQTAIAGAQEQAAGSTMGSGHA